ncbi:MAG: hypothetical protein WD468_11725 [Pirellulales bacterium]
MLPINDHVVVRKRQILIFPAAAARLMSHGSLQPDLPLVGRAGVGA